MSSGLTEEEHDAYSRQIAAYGVEMMMRLKSMDVLVVGLQGVGIETAKNLVLSGPRSVTVHDPTPSTLPDLGTNFFLSPADCAEGRPRDVACVKKLQELNPRVQVKTLYGGHAAASAKQEYNVLELPLPGSGGLDEHVVGMFSVVIFAGNQHGRKELLRWNRFCRTFKAKHIDARGQETSVEQPIGFIACATFGVAAYVFGDFGPRHSVFDDDGQPAPSRAIVGITNDKRGVVTIDNAGAMLQGVSVDDHAGWFEISGVKGMVNKDRSDGRGASINDGLWKFLGKKVEVKEESSRIKGEAPPVGDYPQFKYKIVETKDGEKRMVVNKTINSAFDFHIGDTSGFTAYEGGGVLTQKKVPIIKHFKSLAETIVAPAMVESDFSKMGRPEQLHIGFQALYDFYDKHGKWPNGHDDLKEVIEFAKVFNAATTGLRDRVGDAVSVEEVDEKVLEKLVRCTAAEFQPLGAFFGGIVAQEAMKWTGKFDPLNQLMCVDMFELLNDAAPADIKPLGSGTPTRYDHQLAIFGQALQTKVQNQRTFMVGCGALGCEYLKNFALLGLSTGPHGKVTITDNDRIEVSNLNRQFLFREHNVGQMKSEAGKEAVLQMNPDMHIESKDVLVGPATESVFGDEFWESLDFVTNALDNVPARNYIDGRCVFYGKPLLEAGTQGTMCNGLIVIPRETVSYVDGPKADEGAGGGIPMCTLRNFPNLVTHCVEWARAMFTDIFVAPFQDAQKFASNPAAFIADLEEEVGSDPSRMSAKLEQLSKLATVLQETKGITFEGCVKQAYDLLHSMHRDNILNLIHQYPENAIDKETKQPFWSGSKRFPQAAEWDVNNKMLTSYVISVANILAICYGLGKMPDIAKPATLVPKDHPWRQVATISKALDGVHAKSFVPSTKHIAVNDEDEKKGGNSDDDRARFQELLNTLKEAAGSTKEFVFQPADFEKDCDPNFHIDFIAAATNLRAWNYQLETCTRDKAKVIAGRIIPAILTATASVTGLMSCEMLKLVEGLGREAFRDSSNDLATNSYRFSEPTEVSKRDEKAKALTALARDEKFLAAELAKPWQAEKPHMCRNLVKVAELQQRINGHHQTLKDSRAVPEGFTKWDRTVLTGNNKTVSAIVTELETLTGKLVNSLNIGPHTLFAAEFERPFEQVATGLARRLLDPKCPPFLRDQAFRVYQAHAVGRENNAKYVNSTVPQAAAAVGALSFPRRYLELFVSLVDEKGLEWDTPAVHFDFGTLISNDKTPAPVAPGAVQKKAVQSKLTAGALQRVRKELSRFAKNPPEGCSLVVGPSGDPAKCVATILGPTGTPYEGGIFTFEYLFPENYPSSPPKLRCATKIFHCNVNETGEMCGIPQLKDAWTPALTPNDILNAVTSLLLSPNYEEPLMADIAGLYKKDKKAHDTQAAEITRRFATYTPDKNIDWSKVKIDSSLVSASAQGAEQKGSTVEAKQRPTEEIEKIVRSTKFDWEIKSWKILDIDRHRRYVSQFPELATGTAVSVSTADPSEEKVVHINGDKASEVLKEDVILLSDLTPCELVEYKFADGDWMVSCIGVDSLESYRSSKFGIWKHMALNIWKDCLSSFLRVLKGGPICHMFDDKMFPEAPGDETAWQVVDANGKIRRVAHPVEAMRIYRPATNSYESIDPRLEGAPTEDQVSVFWNSLLQEIRTVTAPQVGADFVDEAFTLDEATWKAKYS